MIEYTIISWKGEPTEVRRLLSEGWRPQGGVASAYWEDDEGYSHLEYTQAMVRMVPPTEEEAAQMRKGIETWQNISNRWQVAPRVSGLVSTEGAAWAMEIQCDCTYNGALGHHPHCPASPEYQARYTAARSE